MSRTRATDHQRSATTRRRVLEGIGVGLTGSIGLVGTGATAGAGTTRETEPNPRVEPTQDAVADQPLIDVHTHLIPDETLDRTPLRADDLVSWMDSRGIDRAVVLALESPESYPVQAPSWWVLEQVAAYPDRLIPFCTVDPRTLVYEDDFGAVTDLLERYVERGARGFGELKAGLAIDDARLETLYELCADHDLPILFHTDEKAMLDEVGLPRLEDVLASYPTVDFIAHAHAWWAHISADVSQADRGEYPSGPIEPGGRVPELLSAYDNIYGDISGISGWNALTRDEAYAQDFLEIHHEQLLFGTDYLHPGQETPQVALFDRFDLPADAWANVRYRTVERLLQ
ncbi:amidohydrolase family protein [Natronorubrum aibiense]|uniref:Amidohydrolase family protein n=1 Tax=Natronorubrum aibiense TaxID=348826 RepID=A0A5P9P038_9EURY|nr:amidohydrolase family protein [Natronorubrum aibiense]QFU81386.1 amidohydrolase family protein [Natronorubrum aibiense]